MTWTTATPGGILKEEQESCMRVSEKELQRTVCKKMHGQQQCTVNAVSDAQYTLSSQVQALDESQDAN